MTSELERPAVRWGLGDVVAGIFTTVVAGLIVGVVLNASGITTGEITVWEVVLSFVVTAAALSYWTVRASRRKGTGSLRDDFGWAWEPYDTLRGVGAGLAGLIGVVLLSVLLGQRSGDPTIGEVDPRGPAEIAVLVATIVVGAPVVEELFFRGLFLRSVERRWGHAAAVIVTSSVFALLHVPQRADLGFVAAFVPLFFLGAVLGSLAVRTRRLGPSIAAHMTVNAIGLIGLLAQQDAG